VFLRRRGEREIDPLALLRSDVELFVRWLEEERRLKLSWEIGGGLDEVRALPTKRRLLVPRPHQWANRTSSWPTMSTAVFGARRCTKSVSAGTTKTTRQGDLTPCHS